MFSGLSDRVDEMPCRDQVETARHARGVTPDVAAPLLAVALELVMAPLRG